MFCPRTPPSDTRRSRRAPILVSTASPVNNIYDRFHRRRQDLFAGMMPQALMALTLADVWQLATSGRAIVLAQGSIDRAATPLAGHGACQPNGAPVVLASYERNGCLALELRLFPAS